MWTLMVKRMLAKVSESRAIPGGLALLAPVLGSMLWTDVAVAQGHGYLNYMRSGTRSYVFVQQSVDGEYGRYETQGEEIQADGSSAPASAREWWKGYGIGTTLGLELMKFVQFVGGHTFVNMRHKDDSQESLTGSRLTGGLRLVFTAPIGNLEVGSGLSGSRLDYQRQLENGSFYGSGYWYSLGMNYFMSSRVSVFYEAKMSHEHLLRNGGTASVDSIDTEMTQMGVGFRIWL